MGSIVRKDQIKNLKASLNSQERLLSKTTGQAFVVTEASFHMDFKHKKPLSGMEIVKRSVSLNLVKFFMLTFQTKTKY